MLPTPTTHTPPYHAVFGILGPGYCIEPSNIRGFMRKLCIETCTDQYGFNLVSFFKKENYILHNSDEKA